MRTWAPAVLAMAVVSGCVTPGGVATNRPVGRLDLSQRGSALQTDFIVPDQVDNLSFVVHDGKGANRDPAAPLAWSLVVAVELKAAQTGRVVFSQVLEPEDLRFTDWHAPATCVLMNIPPEAWKALAVGEVCEVSLRIVESVTGVGMADLFLEWYAP